MLNEISSKTEKAAESPIKINLQLFAEGEPSEPVEPSEPTGDPIEPVEPGNTTVPPELVDPEPAKPVQDHSTNRAFQDMRKRVDAAENFARTLGYNTFEELQMAQQQQNYIDQGYDPAAAQLKTQMDALQQQVQMQNFRARIAEEKASLQGKKYFKDLEPEIDGILSVNPSISVTAAFDFLKGKKMDELVAKETAAAKQKTLNNINSKGHLKTEGDGAGDAADVEIDPDTLQMYVDMGMSKADAQKYHKKLYGR